MTTIQYSFIPSLITLSRRLQNILDKHNIKPVLLFEDLTNPNTKKTAYQWSLLNLFQVFIWFLIY